MERRSFEKRTVMLRGEGQRERAMEILRKLPLYEDSPLRVVFDDPLPSKSRDQECLYHSLIGEFSKQYEHCGKRWAAEDMKRILIDQFRRDTMNDPDIAPLWHSMGIVEMAPSFDGSGVVVLGVQSRKFPMRLASIFVEWLTALCIELNIKLGAY
jgi:hypothetical protein